MELSSKISRLQKLDKLEERILVLENILSKYPVKSENMNFEERVLVQILIETKKEYKLEKSKNNEEVIPFNSCKINKY